jgi:uncharacterized protein YbjQ (UPF0145 family)
MSGYYGFGDGTRLIAMLVVTTDMVPGYRVEGVLGPVVGLTMRSRNPFKAGLAALDGSAVPGAESLLVQCRHEAITEMVRSAKERGANAVIGMRFDHRQVTNSTAEMCAYGTAVVVVPEASTVARFAVPAAPVSQPV